ncbi:MULTISPECIES: hypothetical protein [unclassified Blastococcus]
MTATTANTTLSATVVGRGTLSALTRAEVRYTARSPLLWLGALGYAAISWIPFLDGTAPSGSTAADDHMVRDYGVVALAFTAFLVAAWAALRERPATTAEMFANTPARRWDRTAGLLAAAVVPFTAALVVSVAQGLLVWNAGGIRIGQERWTAELVPTPLELLGAPLFAACSFVAGVAVARLVRSRVLATVVGVLGTVVLFGAFWLYLYSPFGLVGVWRPALSMTDLGTAPSADELASYTAVAVPDQYSDEYFGLDRHLGLYGGHLVYVVGLGLLLSALALARSGRDRRTRRIAAAGAVLAACGIGVALLVDPGAREWLGEL